MVPSDPYDRLAQPKAPVCEHPLTAVTFDEEASKGLSSQEIRKRWPRFHGPCPDCGETMIVYASYLHYVMGDW